MKYLKFHLLASLLVVLLFTGCVKDDPEPDGEETKTEASALTKKINSFIEEVMTDVYLWNDKLPTIDIRYESDSKAYFKKLLFTEDKWSFITDDVVAWENSLQGIELSYGYSLAFGRYVDESNNPTGNYFAIVEYVYPNTPASNAGFVRGDIITKLNNGNITAENYKELLSGTSISVTKGKFNQNTGITVVGDLSMQADTLTLDPVLMKKIITSGGRKIGYLLYMQYISSYNNTSLKDALLYFQENQITDMVLDLRYNPGGMTGAAQYLCSSLAPLNVVNTNSQLVSFQWNEKYQNYWTSTNNQNQLGVKFDNSVPVKLGLSKIYILTGQGTASASELTITGLEPYVDIVQIGDTTYGKYTASITIKPEDWYENINEYNDFKNWGLQPIVIRFANANGVTNFKNGFTPDHRVIDKLLPAYPLGELSEPLLSKAVEQITGVVAMKKAEVPDRFLLYDRGFSRFDPQKRNLFIDRPEEFLKMPE